jgi:ATP-binding cassette, subfamily C, bacterial CydC
VIPQIRGGEMPPAQLAMLALFALASFEAVAPLPSAFLGLGETLAAAKRVFDLADSEPAVWDPASPAPLPDDTTIEVADASFTYAHGRAEALHCVSFSLPPGGKLALIGPSGSGKSTLLQLLLKFRAPDGGRITFGGQPLDDLSGEALRGRIAVATQQSHLFNTTIRENLLLASPGADQTALEQVCRLTLLHDFIEAQPEGYDTLVGETGIRLSGGQARRLTLARALLKDAPVLILDEPTEGLDPHTERALMRNILQWAEGRSLLLITHRLQGLEAMDEILIMREGQIADRGSHQQLTHSSEIYNRLLEQQLLLDPPDESVTE